GPSTGVPRCTSSSTTAPTGSASMTGSRASAARRGSSRSSIAEWEGTSGTRQRADAAPRIPRDHIEKNLCERVTAALRLLDSGAAEAFAPCQRHFDLVIMSRHSGVDVLSRRSVVMVGVWAYTVSTRYLAYVLAHESFTVASTGRTATSIREE